MKTSNLKNLMYLFLFGLLVWSCEERIEMEYTPYEQPALKANDGSLVYEDVTSYPISGNISTTAPTFEYVGVYSLAIDEIAAPEGSVHSDSKFEIDEEDGTIVYDNENESLSEGVYSISVRVQNSGGVAVHDQVVDFNILAVPVDLSIDNSVVEAGIFATGVIATVTASDISGEGAITSISYSLADSSASGFTINSSTGEISKTVNAISGENKISVSVNTNLGAKIFTDVLTVTVGPPPTIEYFQQDGTTALTNVVLSPYTAYTTSAPTLTDMEGSGGWEAILPEALADYASEFSVDLDGKLSIAADAKLPLGTHVIGVKVTNAGDVSYNFTEQFTIEVEERWEAVDLFNDTFDDGSTGKIIPGNTLYPDYAGYTLEKAETDWSKAVITKSGKPTISGLRIQNPATNNHYLVRTIDVSAVKSMRISFVEVSGYNAAFLTVYTRGLYAGDSTSDLEGGTFNPANWNEVMAANDERWPTTSTWATRVGNTVSNVVVDRSAIAGNTLKLAWYIGSTTGQNGQYVIDGVNAQYTSAFPAEEE